MFELVAFLMLVAFLFGAVWNSVFMLRATQGWRRWLVLPSSFLVAVGACGFFGQGLFAVGAQNWLPQSFEWPAGSVGDVLTTADGGHIILIQGVGRVQVYDSNWHFLRGWPVLGARKLRLLEDGNVEALTKYERGFVFDYNGKLISQQTYGIREFVNLENSMPRSAGIFVPTPPSLYIFSSPLLSWLVFATGFVGWFVVYPRSNQSNSAA
jgi:hypothetical protein